MGGEGLVWVKERREEEREERDAYAIVVVLEVLSNHRLMFRQRLLQIRIRVA